MSHILDIATLLLPQRALTIFGEITARMEVEIVNKLRFLASKGNEPICVFIASRGCRLPSEIRITDTMRELHLPFHGIAVGQVFGAAFGIFQACSRREAYAHAEFLLQMPQVCGLLSHDQEAFPRHATAICSYHNRLVGTLSRRARRPAAFWNTLVESERRLSASEALELKLIDRIIPLPK